MVQIGGKTKKQAKADKPQFVIESGYGKNEYLLIGPVTGGIGFTWTGDANSATKFDSKYAAKSFIRDVEGIPANRIIKSL